MQAHPIADSTCVPVTISAQPGAVGVTLRAWPDPRGAPPGTSPGEVLTGTLALAVAWSHATIVALATRLAAVEILLVELTRDPPAEAGAGAIDLHARERDATRYALALAGVAERADSYAIASTTAQDCA